MIKLTTTKELMHLNKRFVFYSALLMDIFQWIVSRNFPGKVAKVHALFSTLWISKKNAKSFSTTEKTVNRPFLTYHQYPVSIVSTWRVQKIILLYFTLKQVFSRFPGKEYKYVFIFLCSTGGLISVEGSAKYFKVS